MVRKDPKFSGNSIYFKSITSSALTGKLAEKKWAVLAKMFPKVTPPDKALKIDTINNRGEKHRLYTFQNVRGYSCNSICRKENTFIMENEKDEKPHW